MSTYDDASLVMIPSGYKTGTIFSQKPMSTDGQLTFTRSNDTATRVASNGLIEKVRTNVLLQSNSFNTTWTNVNTTETSGQAGYDGTNNAWRINDDAVNASHDVRQVVSLSGSLTFSVYAKAGTISWLKLFNGITTAYFNLSTGVAGAGGGVMTSVGNGWYRCSIASNGTSTLALIGMTNADNTSNYAGDGTGTIFIQNAQLESGDIATDYIATTTAAVSVGPVANVPRLDYLNSSCPRLLLEPQRTNAARYYTYFSGYTSARTTITQNATTSPEGISNGTALTPSATSGTHYFYEDVSITAPQVTTLSFFAKENGYDFIRVRFESTNSVYGDVSVWFNVASGTVGTKDAGITASVQDYGNGWYRCIASVASLTTGIGRHYVGIGNTSETNSFAGDGTSGVFMYGFQIETNASYVSSLIPTYGAAVTRGADSASKTGISSLIGQTEGVLYFEAENINSSTTGGAQLCSIDDGTSSKRMELFANTSNLIGVYVQDVSAQVNFTSAVPATGRIKIALAYKLNDYALYINGNLVHTDTSGTVPTVSALRLFGRYDGLANGSQAVKQALLFKTRLTNAQLAELTA